MASKNEEVIQNASDNDLKRKIDELKSRNETLGLAIQRSRHSVKRLKLEYGVLLERLESRVDLDPELRFENPLPNLSSFRDQLMNKPLKRSKGKRQRAKERDPNMPKRPTNAYLIYCEMNKEKIRENGSLDVTRDLAEGWKNLDESGRLPYYELYNEDRERYQKEMKIYNENLKSKSEIEIKNDENEKLPGEEDEVEEEVEEDDTEVGQNGKEPKKHFTSNENDAITL
ncbi:hypothetical protein KAFR_0F02510 [Kazachstania africana CBS 2517]|uniref:HMG box domain-containing protein n=1 Tax=Kazachstania africana (strain ATCC 22294 / BCRC 22015 / CBS 2517 / CECT 1963 / NBRC 1671 / NRRL Y-8276) TaxID=1071382 RepID=H2AWU8_KAZAF|nr:hypothetical protein KAFR_0F02510 [Kazachstania africana CBS 2517]CCF58848.1 hypothetical protein KAFR_0F02510 [Kazachstania africana CBS 2517]